MSSTSGALPAEHAARIVQHITIHRTRALPRDRVVVSPLNATIASTVREGEKNALSMQVRDLSATADTILYMLKFYTTIVAAIVVLTGCSSNTKQADTILFEGTRQMYSVGQTRYDYYCEQETLKLYGKPIITINNTEALDTNAVKPGDTVLLEYSGHEETYAVLCIPASLTGFTSVSEYEGNAMPFPILSELYQDPDKAYVAEGYKTLTDSNGTYLWYRKTIDNTDNAITDTLNDYSIYNGKLVKVSINLKKIKELYSINKNDIVYAASGPDTFIIVGYEKIKAYIEEDKRTPSLIPDMDPTGQCHTNTMDSIEYVMRARLVTVNTNGDILGVWKAEEHLGWVFGKFLQQNADCSIQVDLITSITMTDDNTIVITPRSYPWGVAAIDRVSGDLLWKLDGNDETALGNPTSTWVSAPSYAGVSNGYLYVYDNAFSRGESRSILLPIKDNKIDTVNISNSTVNTVKVKCGNYNCISTVGGSVEIYGNASRLLISTGMVITTTEYMAGKPSVHPGILSLTDNGVETWRATINGYSVVKAYPLDEIDITNFK